MIRLLVEFLIELTEGRLPKHQTVRFINGTGICVMHSLHCINYL